MAPLSWRDLSPSEVVHLGAIDRSERIDALYVHRMGRLELQARVEHVSGWERSELAQYVARLGEVLNVGGAVLGAWDGLRLLGVGSLDPRPVGGDPHLMKLDMLYVDAGTCFERARGRSAPQRSTSRRHPRAGRWTSIATSARSSSRARIRCCSRRSRRTST